MPHRLTISEWSKTIDNAIVLNVPLAHSARSAVILVTPETAKDLIHQLEEHLAHPPVTSNQLKLAT